VKIAMAMPSRRPERIGGSAAGRITRQDVRARPVPSARADHTQIFRGASPPARFWSLTWLQVRDRMVSAGTPGEVVDAGRTALADPARWFHGPARVIAWGRAAQGR
jgi:hypothetical protein